MLNQKTLHYIAIFILWLFHVSGILGITFGNRNWFVERTGLNLLVTVLVLIFFFKIDTFKKIILFIGLGIAGVFFEYLGVNYSLLFGDYEYGENLGTKIGGVPIFIGVNWALLTYISGAVANKIHANWLLKALIGTGLMLTLDFLMEKTAPIFDFWKFEGGIAPLSNYTAWAIIAFGFNCIFQLFKVKGNFQISLHIFLVQLVFFSYFYAYY